MKHTFIAGLLGFVLVTLAQATVRGDIKANSIVATHIDVTELSAISGDLGFVSAGEVELGGGYASGGLTIDEDGLVEVGTLTVGFGVFDNGVQIDGTASQMFGNIFMEDALYLDYTAGGGSTHACLDNFGLISRC